MATAYTGTIVLAKGSPNGPRESKYFTASDVAAAGYVFQDGNAFMTVPANAPYFLVDVVLSAAGADTTTSQIYVNGAPTPAVIVNVANVYTVLNRQIQSAPVGFQPGSSVKFYQQA